MRHENDLIFENYRQRLSEEGTYQDGFRTQASTQNFSPAEQPDVEDEIDIDQSDGFEISDSLRRIGELQDRIIPDIIESTIMTIESLSSADSLESREPELEYLTKVESMLNSMHEEIKQEGGSPENYDQDALDDRIEPEL